MRYLLLICSDEHQIGSMSETEGSTILAEYGQFMEEMGKRGVLQGGERLQPTTTATTVRVRNGTVLTSDGAALAGRRKRLRHTETLWR